MEDVLLHLDGEFFGWVDSRDLGPDEELSLLFIDIGGRSPLETLEEGSGVEPTHHVLHLSLERREGAEWRPTCYGHSISFRYRNDRPYLPIGQHPVERQSLRSHSLHGMSHRRMVLTAGRHFGILPGLMAQTVNTIIIIE